jgi:hypothetical protein
VAVLTGTKEVVLTLGARKVTLLFARGDGTVDVTPEGGIAEVANLVVGLDVLLNSLTAVGTGQRELLRASGRKHDGMRRHRQLPVYD